MSADILRRAAALMRERAEAAQRFVDLGQEWWGPDGLIDAFTALSGEDETVIWGIGEDAEHIASWHPAVALAVADWLEETADHLSIETSQYADGSVCLAVDAAAADCSIFQSALAVARTYLGSDA